MDNQNTQPRIDGEELNGQTMRIPEVLPAEETPVEELPELSGELFFEEAEPETAEEVAQQISEAVAAETDEAYFADGAAQKEDDWLDEILPEQQLPRELEADELAVADAGLMHPEDVELENIIRQTNEEAAEADATQMFVPVDPAALPEEEDEEADEKEADAEDDEPPLRKRRPKWKKGYGLLRDYHTRRCHRGFPCHP